MSCCGGPSSCFHLSLTATSLPRSTEFYHTLFGVEPVKRREDYVKFELADPPLVLALELGRRMGVGPVNHVGFRVSDSKQLVDTQRRLELAGFATLREDGVECCYARQTKFWVKDPDGVLWELYVMERDLDHRGEGGVPLTIADPSRGEPES